MRYLSPASLSGGSVINLADKKALQLQRKKLLAELELNVDGQLIIKNRTFSKNEILAYFESLEDDTVLGYHEAVGKDTVLVEFLESGWLPAAASFTPSSFYGNMGFLQWISPYFYLSFTEYAKDCLQRTNEQGLKNLLQNFQLLTDYDRERAWLEIGQVLEDKAAVLENYQQQASRKNGKLDMAGISPLISDSFIRMILQLPQNRFSGVRDKYAFSIMQLSVLLFNRSRLKRDLAECWMYNAKSLAVSESLYDQAVAKAQKMDNLKKKNGNTLGVRVAIVLGIIVLRIIFSGDAGCNSSRNSSNQRIYTKLIYTPLPHAIP
jgi:hypothetical protein